MRVTRLQVIEGTNKGVQIVYHVFHSFLVEVQMNAGFLRAKHG